MRINDLKVPCLKCCRRTERQKVSHYIMQTTRNSAKRQLLQAMARCGTTHYDITLPLPSCTVATRHVRAYVLISVLRPH